MILKLGHLHTEFHGFLWSADCNIAISSLEMYLYEKLKNYKAFQIELYK